MKPGVRDSECGAQGCYNRTGLDIGTDFKEIMGIALTGVRVGVGAWISEVPFASLRDTVSVAGISPASVTASQPAPVTEAPGVRPRLRDHAVPACASSLVPGSPERQVTLQRHPWAAGAVWRRG